MMSDIIFQAPNNKNGVSSEAPEQVLWVAPKHNYRPNIMGLEHAEQTDQSDWCLDGRYRQPVLR